MKLEEFIKQYSFKDIIQIEQTKDAQFIALKNNWEKIKQNTPKDKLETYKTNYLYMIIQTALISFQLSGKGENWWEEISSTIASNSHILENNSNLQRREEFLNDCKNNKRFVAMKLSRLKKLDFAKTQFDNIEKLDFFYNNMSQLNEILAYIMNQKLTSKTIVFAVKMFGYGSRFIFDNFIPYPFEIQIPVDSRIEAIYKKETGKEKYSQLEVMEYFNNLSKEFGIPPLHLDGLLWIEYWYNQEK